MTVPQSEWKWFGHAGHFIGGRDCRFHLCTLVGDVLVSTVGEYLPDSQVREIFAKSRGITLNGKGDAREADYLDKLGYEDLGYQRKYETMAFRAGNPCISADCGYGLPAISGSGLATRGANDAGTSAEQHYEICLLASRGIIEKDDEYGYERLTGGMNDG